MHSVNQIDLRILYEHHSGKNDQVFTHFKHGAWQLVGKVHSKNKYSKYV